MGQRLHELCHPGRIGGDSRNDLHPKVGGQGKEPREEIPEGGVEQDVSQGHEGDISPGECPQENLGILPSGVGQNVRVAGHGKEEAHDVGGASRTLPLGEKGAQDLQGHRAGVGIGGRYGQNGNLPQNAVGLHRQKLGIARPHPDSKKGSRKTFRPRFSAHRPAS